MIMSTMSDSMKMIANAMVMRSRFFSTMLVPVCVEYTELAIMSEMPVPLPECSRMNTMRPRPETTSRTSMMIRSGFKIRLSSFVQYITVRKSLSIAKNIMRSKEIIVYLPCRKSFHSVVRRLHQNEITPNDSTKVSTAGAITTSISAGMMNMLMGKIIFVGSLLTFS